MKRGRKTNDEKIGAFIATLLLFVIRFYITTTYPYRVFAKENNISIFELTMYSNMKRFLYGLCFVLVSVLGVLLGAFVNYKLKSL